MSGGIGPTTKDISFPSDGGVGDDSGSLPGHSPNHRFLSFRQVNSLALCIVLAASGLVPAFDFAFALLSFPYILFLSRFAFPPLHPSRSPAPSVFGVGNRLLAMYMNIAALIGIFLPIAYISYGMMDGDKEGIKAAAPHLFLLASQVFMEGVTFSPQFSLPIRVFVPVFYNALRMLKIIDWLKSEVLKDAAYGSLWRSDLRLVAGRGLALANLALWSFNLFAFLLPVYLPRALNMHYGYKDKEK